MDGEFVAAGEAAALLLHLPDAVEANGDDGDLEILDEEADAGLEGGHAGIITVVHDAFGEEEEAVAAVYRFTSEAETFAETGELRERENVE